MAPALFIESDNAMRINREEIFGPVASVVRVRDYEEGSRRRERHSVRAHVGNLHDVVEARQPFQTGRRERHG